MAARSDIVAEIHRLIDEQMRAVAGKLSPEEALAYAKRNEQLAELVNRLSSGNLRED